MTNAPESFALHPINREKISKGGYKVSYGGHVPPGHTLWLGLPDLSNAMEVTGKSSHNLLDASNLPKFLSLIGKQNWWGQKGRCKLFVKKGGAITLQSALVEFDCPVRPLVCRHFHLGPSTLGPRLGLTIHELHSLKYGSDDAHGLTGRVLHIPAIDGCYYFHYGQRFETSNERRGLVCTSYIGAVWKLETVPNGPMTWPGNTIASCQGAPFFCKEVPLKDKPLEQVKAFLLDHKDSTYIVGSHGHVVLAVKGHIHEFTTVPRNGYNERTIEEWKPYSKIWTVGRPALQFEKSH